MKYQVFAVGAVDMSLSYGASTVSSFQRFSTVFDRMQRFNDAYICTQYSSIIHPVESAFRHDKVYASSQRGRSINTMRSRPRARRKDFLEIPTLDGWACARKSSHWSRARREFPSCGGPFVSHVWSRGSTLLAARTDMPMMLPFFVRSSAFAFSAP